ncbi:lipid II:glycine glycyltransferase FemX [Actinomyces minihominis]|uniref:lipid II:glycine glycyltransferase FemX n=1 Tax=Actinomyces minihominis TaxID=2002838 RepID=UPI000C0879C7|nr:GNAT family N-acetyltransferase [Actinomyces minihominis]
MTTSQVVIRPTTAQEMRDHAVAAQVNVPIEQTWVWAEFEETFPDRQLVGFFSIAFNGEVVAILGMTEYRYHGFNFLWCKHGPTWLVDPTEELERAALQALIKWIKRNNRGVAFLRLHLEFPGPDAFPPMQITTYDQTVVVRLSEDEDELMAGFKKRARTKVRGVIRKTPVDLADETDQAAEDFSPYFEIMAETADRQGFTPWPPSVYENMLRTLKREHSRLYAARVDGELVAFAIFTLSGQEAVYYYAAATENGRAHEASIQVLHHAFKELGAEGLTTMDLMGVGSELAPSLHTLTPFKSGFAPDITQVPPAFDVPVNRARFRMLELLREGKSKLDTLKDRVSEREKGD